MLYFDGLILLRAQKLKAEKMMLSITISTHFADAMTQQQANQPDRRFG